MTDEQTNRILAERVMGWHKIVSASGNYWADDNNDYAMFVDIFNYWQPTQNIEQALMCAEKFSGSNAFDIYYNSDGLGYECTLYNDHEKTITCRVDKDISLAICSALLEAIGEKVNTADADRLYFGGGGQVKERKNDKRTNFITQTRKRLYAG